jgi:uncharacterized protein (TIGR02246 family)
MHTAFPDRIRLLEEDMLRIAAISLALLPLAAMARTGTKADDEAIRAVLDRFAEAWNKHDAHAFAAVFAEDADFTNVFGQGASGRAKIEEQHARIFATMFKDSHQKQTDIKIRYLRPEIAAVDVQWEMTGARDPQGNPWPFRRGLLSLVMMKNAGQWQIVVMHNQELAVPPAR